jgi:hypothetical protein
VLLLPHQDSDWHAEVVEDLLPRAEGHDLTSIVALIRGGEAMALGVNLHIYWHSFRILPPVTESDPVPSPFVYKRLYVCDFALASEGFSSSSVWTA